MASQPMEDTAPTTTPLYDRIPEHLHRFVDDVGEGFLLGAACGSALHLARGLRGSGGAPFASWAARAAAPRVAGYLAAYSAVLCGLESAIALARGKDDAWGSVAAGAGSLGLLTATAGHGARVAAWSAAFGAAVAAASEGARWVISEWDTRFSSQPAASRNPPGLPLAPAANPSLTDLRGSEKDREVLDMRRKFLLYKEGLR